MSSIRIEAHSSRKVRFMLAELLVLLLSFKALTQTPCSSAALTQAAAVEQSARIAEATEILHCLRAGDPNWRSDSPPLEKASWLHVRLVHDRKAFPSEDLMTVEAPFPVGLILVTQVCYRVILLYSPVTNCSWQGNCFLNERDENHKITSGREILSAFRQLWPGIDHHFEPCDAYIYARQLLEVPGRVLLFGILAQLHRVSTSANDASVGKDAALGSGSGICGQLDHFLFLTSLQSLEFPPRFCGLGSWPVFLSLASLDASLGIRSVLWLCLAAGGPVCTEDASGGNSD